METLGSFNFLEWIGILALVAMAVIVLMLRKQILRSVRIIVQNVHAMVRARAAIKEIKKYITAEEELYECVLAKIRSAPEPAIQQYLYSDITDILITGTLPSEVTPAEACTDSEQRLYKKCRWLLSVLIQNKRATVSEHQCTDAELATYMYIIEQLPITLQKRFIAFRTLAQKITKRHEGKQQHESAAHRLARTKILKSIRLEHTIKLKFIRSIE